MCFHFIINEISKSIANFLENELVNGAGTNMKGLAQNTNTYLGATTLVITPQELIAHESKSSTSISRRCCMDHAP
jgi:hypothetical protein